MKNKHILLSLLLLPFCWLLAAMPALAEAPRVVKSTPADGAANVSTHLEQIVILFDRNMKMNSYSVLEVQGAPFPPLVPDDEPWETPIKFVLKIKDLKPNTRYALQLNSATKKGFQSAEDQTPLPPTLLAFTTGTDSASTGAASEPGTPRSSGPGGTPAMETGRVSGGTSGQPLVLNFDAQQATPVTSSNTAAPSAPAANPLGVAPTPASTTGPAWPTPPPASSPQPAWPAQTGSSAAAPTPAWGNAPSSGGSAEANPLLDRMETAIAQLRSIAATLDSTMSMNGQTMMAHGQYASDLSSGAFAMQTVTRSPQGEMRSKMVCDGQTVWQDMEMGGQRMVQKASLALLQQMNGGTSPNPIVGARMLRQQFDFNRVSTGAARDGTAVHVLEGSYKPAYLQQVQQQIQMTEQQNPQMAAQMRQQLNLIKAIRFQVGAQDGLPRAQEMLDSQGQVVMGMYLSALSANQPVAPTLFQYTPPPGVPVMDMSQMMR